MARQKKYDLPYGEGSFYYDEKRNRWIGSIEAGTNAAGKRRRIVVSAKDKDAAWDKLTAKRKEIMIDGVTPEGVSAGATVKSWLTEWLEQREKTVRPKTHKGERTVLTAWVIPTLGQRKLADLSPADMRKLTDAMEDAGKSSTYARTTQQIFQQALKDAVLEGHTVPQRAIMAKKPAKSINDRDAIPISDAIKLLENVNHTEQPVLWVVTLLQGLRQSERLGLTWELSGVDTGVMDISWQLQQLPYADRRKGTFDLPRGYEARRLWRSYHLVRPKSRAGQRVIPLLPTVQQQLRQMRDAAIDCGTYSPSGLVFPRPDGTGRPQDHKADLKAWKALQATSGVCKRVGETPEQNVYYVLHEARHTTATLLLAAGVDPAIITAILGHSDIVTTRGYQHADAAMLRGAIEQVAAQLQISSSLSLGA